MMDRVTLDAAAREAFGRGGVFSEVRYPERRTPALTVVLPDDDEAPLPRPRSVARRGLRPAEDIE